MKRIMFSAIAALGIVLPALAEDFTPADPGLTFEELQTQVVGNSSTYEYDGATIKEYVDPNGELRGESSKDGKYTAHWKLREDGLFCFDYGNPGMDPGQDGCTQLCSRATRSASGALMGCSSHRHREGNAFGL